jgi:hypothetical protein
VGVGIPLAFQSVTFLFPNVTLGFIKSALFQFFLGPEGVSFQLNSLPEAFTLQQVTYYFCGDSKNCIDILKKEGILSSRPRGCVHLLIHVRL